MLWGIWKLIRRTAMTVLFAADDLCSVSLQMPVSFEFTSKGNNSTKQQDCPK